ncbi:protein phosphatase 2C 29-like [Telopea speciosissima]|uniref:protein phosphatase 2C 29-like n=1 Tax=Telopea speciosissima TaxID=54955 RepID=UPI001CC3D2D3|nr:protein phosphatase 2C 29-like [Telopea speciosissima]
MGGGFSCLFPCLNPVDQTHQADLLFTEPLDETLGHSFCYVPSSARFLSPSHSDRLSPSSSLRLSPSHDPKTTLFKSISGASVSANTSAPRTVLQHDHIYEDATDFSAGSASRSSTVVNGFESTSSFTALPLQPVPRGGGDASGPIDRGFFMSGPIERGALSGPLDVNSASDGGGVHFSAPLGGLYVKRRRKKGISDIRKAFYRNFSDKKRPWVVPVLNFVGRKEAQSAAAATTAAYGGGDGELEGKNDSVQWAHGKAGEDRVHVVVSEEHGWLFVGIYDGFNGPDAPEFLMGNLYRAVFTELHGLFWKNDDDQDRSIVTARQEQHDQEDEGKVGISLTEPVPEQQPSSLGVNDPQVSVKRVTFQQEQKSGAVRKPLWEFLAEDSADDGLDLSGSNRFAFSVDDALRVSNAGTGRRRRSLLLSKLRYGFSKSSREGGQSRELFPWRYDLEEKEKIEVENRADERTCRSFRKRTVGPIDHESVLRAISKALEVTESAYLEMTDKVLDRYPELALMGSCLLVVLMRDEDVYVMNVGDSRAIVAQYQPHAIDSSSSQRGGNDGAETEGIVEESSGGGGGYQVGRLANEAHAERMRLTALQLSTDHSTSIEEEVLRIKEEHPDDSQCIVNDRVKGRLKVTRAFGAGFLKQPKLNSALLEIFRNDYIGSAPYISCCPSLRHHKLGASDQFLVLSSDGLYQYFTNEEVVSHVEGFMERFPDGDPAQHLIEELLYRAAKKAGMDFHELLDIPQGDRRKYHDDVTVMVISLEGRIWKSSGKYL